MLRLEPVRTHGSDEPDVRVLGTFCHNALRRCYELLLPTGWPGKPVTDDTIDWCIESAIEEAATDVNGTIERAIISSGNSQRPRSLM